MIFYYQYGSNESSYDEDIINLINTTLERDAYYQTQTLENYSPH